MTPALVLSLAAQVPEQAPVTAIASSAQDGPIVEGLSAGLVAELVADYAVNYQAFLTKAASLVNRSVLAAENDQPEGYLIQLVLTGLHDPLTGNGMAVKLANAINTDWADGKIRDSAGEEIPAWPNATAIAYGTGATLTLQWIKGQPWVWVVVGVLLAIAALSLYELLVHGTYSMGSAAPSTIGKVALGLTSAAIRNWPVILVGAGLLVATPFVIRKVAATREAVNLERYAQGGGM